MIQLRCLIELLDVHNIVHTHTDNHKIGAAPTYFFGTEATQSFESDCLPYEAAEATLSDYNLQHLIKTLLRKDCQCEN